MIRNTLINGQDERVIRLVGSLERIRKCLMKLRERTPKRTFYEETYLTDKELQEKLKVSRRTLQEWRNDGRISYILIGGKILYPESCVQEMLEKNRRNVK